MTNNAVMDLPVKQTRKQGHFLTNGTVAWPIKSREIANLYRTKTYIPTSPWKYRRVIYIDAISLSGYLVMSAVQKPMKKIEHNEQD